MTGFDYDVLIIGPGFGGSVTALRAAEKGYRAGVIERAGAGPTTTSPRPSGTCPASCGSPAPSCTARASVAARTSTPTRCTSRRGSSSTRRCGRASRTRRATGTVPGSGQADARRGPLPVPAHRRGPVHACGRDRNGAGERSTGPERMAHDAITFINAMALGQADLLGFSIGSFVAQQITLIRPATVRRLIVASSAPQGAVGMHGWAAEVIGAIGTSPKRARKSTSTCSSPSRLSAGKSARQQALRPHVARTEEPGHAATWWADPPGTVERRSAPGASPSRPTAAS